jgi:hypothetical protein
MAYVEIEHCEICRRPFAASALIRGVCASCAETPKPRPPVDLYSLDDGDAEKPVERVCKECGAHFVASRLARFCPACRVRRDKESQARIRARRKANRAARKVVPRELVCEMCGAPLDNPKRKYCEPCAEKRYNERLAEWRRTHRAEINETQRAAYHARKAKKAAPEGGKK